MPSNSVQLEMIVRPSTAAPIRPAFPTSLLTAPAVVEKPKTWGSSGNSIFDLRAHDEATIKPATWPESDRTFDEVKVKSKDDPEVFISTEVMTSFRSIDPKTGKIGFTQKFPPPQTGGDVEVTARNKTRTSNLK